MNGSMKMWIDATTTAPTSSDCTAGLSAASSVKLHSLPANPNVPLLRTNMASIGWRREIRNEMLSRGLFFPVAFWDP